MVVNAPQSNILSAAEHTLALLLAQARNVPQANADLEGRHVEPRRSGKASSCTARRSASSASGRVGVLVAQRAHAFGMRLVAYDPFVSADRARQLGVQLVPTIEELVAIVRLRHDPRHRRRPRRSGSSTPTCSRTPSPGCGSINAGRGGIVDEDALADGDRATAGSAAPRSTRSRRSRPPSRRCSRSTTSSSRRTSARRPPRRRTRRARRSPSRSCSRCAATSCRSRSTSPRRRRRRACGRSCRSPSGSAGCSPAWPAARRRRSNIDYEGEIADYDCRVLTLSVLKGVLAPVVDEPVSFVNAPQIAEQRGIVGARDEVVRRARLREPHRRARRSAADARRRRRCSASSRRRASSASTSTPSTCRPRATCSSCTTTTCPGMIGSVGVGARRRGRQHLDMDVGQSPSGEAALMVIATETPVPRRSRRAGRRASRASSRARAIDLG